MMTNTMMNYGYDEMMMLDYMYEDCEDQLEDAGEEMEPYEEMDVNEDTYYTNDSVRAYLKEISRFKLLTAEEEMELGRKIAAGGPGAADAKNLMINSNLRLVVKVAKHYLNRGMEFIDLISCGNLGLIKAVDKFDPERGFRFSTYAVWWIRQDITRAIGTSASLIHIPIHVNEKANKLRHFYQEMSAKYDREPTKLEITEALNIPLDKVDDILMAMPSFISFTHPIRDTEDCVLQDILEDKYAISPESAGIQSVLTETLKKMMSKLSDRDALILKLRFGLEDQYERTLEEVGAILGITRERVRQIETAALRALATPKNKRLLREYLY